MSDIVKGLKNVWMKGMEAIGDTASNIANNTKYKVQEMNLINRRHEILSDFGSQAYALWQQGVEFPEELQKQLEELSKVDESLNTIRAERLAYLQTIEEEKAARAAAEAETAEIHAEEAAAADAKAEDAEDPVEASVPVMDIPDEPDVQEEENAEVPVLEIPEAAEENDTSAEAAAEQLMEEEPPVSSAEADVQKSEARIEFEKKVGRALDTMQDKVSKLGKALDRSVQNLAKVVLQNEEKQEKKKDINTPKGE